MRLHRLYHKQFNFLSYHDNRYANVFVTAPSPENLKTVFEFVIMGLKDLKYAGNKSGVLMSITSPL